MAEAVKCDGCGKAGLRGIGYPAPTDWTYAEILVEGIPGAKAPATMVLLACTPACQGLIWKQGPGPLAEGAAAFARELRRRVEGGRAPDDYAPESHVILRKFEMQPVRLAAVVDSAGKIIGHVAAPQPCIFSEGTCKAADCPEHSIFPRRP
jgi:hypothetical protein